MGPDGKKKLPVTVLLLGGVSLLTDVASEMIFPLLPAFLAARVGQAPLLLGAMEGVADAWSAALKAWSGRAADRSRHLRPMVMAGYSVAAVARPLMAFVTLPWHALLIRVADRTGKGLRTSPRDALIAHSVPEGSRGRAFGFHRSMDHAGAAVGALLASLLVAFGMDVPSVFLLAAIPGLLGVLLLFGVKEPPRPKPAVRRTSTPTPLPPELRRYLVAIALFSTANATDAFLLLKLTELGAAPAILPLAWLMLQALKSAASYPAGRLADRVGNGRMLLAGWMLYAVCYIGLGFADSVPLALGWMAFYGLYHALTEGAERALVADLAPPEARGHAFGMYNALTGGAAVAAGVGFGGVWTAFGSKVAFLGAGGLATLGAAVLWGWTRAASRQIQ